MTRRLRTRGTICVLLGVLLGVLLAPAAAQDSGDAERRLQTVKRELEEVASDRRRIEGERGGAARELRRVDERLGESSRQLHRTEAQLAREHAALDELRQRRDLMQARLVAGREERARLLRAAYMQRNDSPLKVLLAHDRVADAARLLNYHRYLQQDRARRLAAVDAELARLDTLERDIATRRAALDATLKRQRAQLAQLEDARGERADVVARLDARYRDRREREQALGRDAQGLEQLLRKLREAAARARAEREAAAERAARDGQREPAAPPSAPELQVGGLGWPLSGALLAGYRGTLPDGRDSDGLLIGADAGTPVQAVADGRVAHAAWMTGYGLLLIIDHGNGYMSLYAHNEALLRDPGEAVERGDSVATVGSSGGHGRPALYFELRRDGKTVDPDAWLKR